MKEQIEQIRFDLTELSWNQILYCCLVWGLEDWHHLSFREVVIEKERKTVIEIWGDAPRLHDAAHLSQEGVNIAKLSPGARWSESTTNKGFYAK